MQTISALSSSSTAIVLWVFAWSQPCINTELFNNMLATWPGQARKAIKMYKGWPEDAYHLQMIFLDGCPGLSYQPKYSDRSSVPVGHRASDYLRLLPTSSLVIYNSSRALGVNLTGTIHLLEGSCADVWILSQYASGSFRQEFTVKEIVDGLTSKGKTCRAHVQNLYREMMALANARKLYLHSAKSQDVSGVELRRNHLGSQDTDYTLEGILQLQDFPCQARGCSFRGSKEAQLLHYVDLHFLIDNPTQCVFCTKPPFKDVRGLFEHLEMAYYTPKVLCVSFTAAYKILSTGYLDDC